MNLPPIILASASPRRAQLLREMELDFVILPARTPESDHQFMTPREVCQLNAYRKARLIAKQNPDALVIGADTEVVLGARIFGKPANRAEAGHFLRDLQGHDHEVITGVCLIHLRRHREKLFAVGTRVFFRPLGDADIEAYLGKINPLDKAGAYAIQEHGDLIIEKIEGSHSNVVGLPTEALGEALEEFAV